VNVVVFDYGAGNVHSACQALRNVGADVTLTDNPSDALAADGLLVPGVGAFGYVMDSFSMRGGPQLIRERLASGKPILGICVGMQIFFEEATEKGIHKGLGLLTGTIEELPFERLPHMGWSVVTPPEDSVMFRGVGGHRFYFVHSYARRAFLPVKTIPDGKNVKVAQTGYPEPFISAVEAGPLWATQFHPEKSGNSGLALLKNWISFIESEQ
jgi:imidazole glycerol phosphate synthase, glutamine amidotransferase subunit